MSKRVALSVKSADGLESLLDPRFGRAEAFIVVDPDTLEVVDEFQNEAAAAAQGAGTEAAAAMKNHQVDVVISGAFGPKAYQALSAFGVEMWMAPDGLTVRETLKKLAAGGLQQMKVKVY